MTAFTVGHSLTLALAALGVVQLPQQPIEAAIALSIYVLGVELLATGRTQASLLRKWPWAMAGLFGLLHGLGFVPLALFAFNLGIEAGQLAFVAVVLATGVALRAFPIRWPAYALRLPAYGIGSLAAFWFFERVAASLQRLAS